MTKRTMKKVLMASAASLLILGATVGSALGFFSDTAKTKADAEITLKPGIKTEETLKENDKEIILDNTGETEEYMRVQIISSSSVTTEISGEGWTAGENNYWYYETAVKAGESTKPIYVKVSTTDLEADTDITVLGECAMHLYDKPNNAAYPGWTASGDTNIGYSQDKVE